MQRHISDSFSHLPTHSSRLNPDGLMFGGGPGSGSGRILQKGKSMSVAQGRGTMSMPTSPLRTGGNDQLFPWNEGPQSAQAFFHAPQAQGQDFPGYITETTWFPPIQHQQHLQTQVQYIPTSFFSSSSNPSTPPHLSISEDLDHDAEVDGGYGGTEKRRLHDRDDRWDGDDDTTGEGRGMGRGMNEIEDEDEGDVQEFPARKKRAQVRVACTHCQKACKKCSNTRPCDRCVKYGFKDCVDSARKPRKTGIKRGPYKRRTSSACAQEPTFQAPEYSTVGTHPSFLHQPHQSHQPHSRPQSQLQHQLPGFGHSQGPNQGQVQGGYVPGPRSGNFPLPSQPSCPVQAGPTGQAGQLGQVGQVPEISLSQAFAAAFERNAPRWINGQRQQLPVDHQSPSQTQNQGLVAYEIPGYSTTTRLDSGSSIGISPVQQLHHQRARPRHPPASVNRDGQFNTSGEKGTGAGTNDPFLGRRPSMPPPLQFPISLNSSAGQDPFSRAVSPIGRQFSVGTDYFKSVDARPRPLPGHQLQYRPPEQDQNHEDGQGRMDGDQDQGVGHCPPLESMARDDGSTNRQDGDGSHVAVDIDMKPFSFGDPSSGGGSSTYTPSSISLCTGTDSRAPSNAGSSNHVGIVDYTYPLHQQHHQPQNQTSHATVLSPSSQVGDQPLVTHHHHQQYWSLPPSPKSNPSHLTGNTVPSSLQVSKGLANNINIANGIGSRTGTGDGRRPSLLTFLGTSIRTPLFNDLSRPFFSTGIGGDQSPTLFDGPMDHDHDHELELQHEHEHHSDPHSRDQSLTHSDPPLQLDRDHEPRTRDKGQTLSPLVDTQVDDINQATSRTREDDEYNETGYNYRDKGGDSPRRRMSVLWPNVGAVGRLSLSKGSEGLGLGLGLEKGLEGWK